MKRAIWCYLTLDQYSELRYRGRVVGRNPMGYEVTIVIEEPARKVGKETRPRREIK